MALKDSNTSNLVEDTDASVVAPLSAADAQKLIEAQYATIGRTGVGTGANQIDETGLRNWTNALVSGEFKPEDLGSRFGTAVTDYMAQNPDDQYTQYVKNYRAGLDSADTGNSNVATTVVGGLTGATADNADTANTGAITNATSDVTGLTTGNVADAGTLTTLAKNDASTVATVPDYTAINNLYQTELGREGEQKGLEDWYKQFGNEIDDTERAQFKTAAQAELDSRTQDLYSEFMGSGRIAEKEGLDYWRGRFGNEIDASEKEEFRQAAAAELSGAFGKDGLDALAGFKYARDLGVNDAGLKSTLGEDLYNQYQNRLKSTATTSINDIVADNSATFEESQKVANFARALGYDSQQLADLTGKDKALFDTILTNYDTNRTKIINDTLTGAKVLTDADRVIASYALEKQFGFTDDDIAKATGVDVNVIKSSLNPVRNFETDFSKIANDTDSTTQQLKDFVTNAKSNTAVNKLYGEALTGYENKIAELEQKWSRYGSDAIQSENLFQQLNAQKNALGGQYFQGVFGDLENSAALLVKKGLDTVGDLGQKDKFVTAGAIEVLTTADGQRVLKQGDEYLLPITDSEGSITSYEKVDPSKVTKKYFKSEDNGDGSAVVSPLSEKELATLKDGKFQQKIGSVVIDKDTGTEITDLTGQLAFQKSGGVFTGKNHWLNAKFTADGTPYLTATTEKTGINAFVSEMGPMVISIAAMIPGPHQPFAMAANAAIALEQKNYLGAVLSGLNAYGTFTGNELATLKAAEASGDIINTSRVLDLQNTASNIKLAQTAVSGFAALQADNIAGVINSSLSAYGQTGGTLPSGVTTAMQAGSFVAALDANNMSAAMVSLGDLTGSKDMYVAASAKNLIDAFKSGNEANIVKAGIAFGNAFQTSGQQSKTDNNTSTVSKTAPLSQEDIDMLTPEQLAIYQASGSQGLINYNREQKALRLSGSTNTSNTAETGATRSLTGTSTADTDFVNSEFARLTGLGYTKDQISNYFDRLDALTSNFDIDDSTVIAGGDGADADTVTVTGKNVNNTVSGLDSVSDSNATDLGTVKVVGNRPTDFGNVEIVGDLPKNVDTTVIQNDDDTTTTIVVTDKGEVKTHDCASGYRWDEATQACVADAKVVIPKVNIPVVNTPTVKTPVAMTSPLSGVGTPPPVLDTSERMLKGAPAQKRMELAKLRQLFASLTPEMAAVLSDRGFEPPKFKEDKLEEAPSAKAETSVFGNLSDELYKPTFMATGGSVLESMKPKFIEHPKHISAAPVVGTGGVDSPLKLATLKHLYQSVGRPMKALGGLAQGGLPQKYAKAAPKGHKPEFITGLTGYYATGKGTGQSDDIPAMLHDGDYVIDADAVAALGDGSSKAGAEALSEFQSKVPHSMSTGGQAVPAKIADGEYVFPEAFVSAIGGGDNKLGAKRLDAMREELRAHKRSAPTSKIPPKAKSPLDYLRMAKG
jgi:hypothetical protein